MSLVQNIVYFIRLFCKRDLQLIDPTNQSNPIQARSRACACMCVCVFACNECVCVSVVRCEALWLSNLSSNNRPFPWCLCAFACVCARVCVDLRAAHRRAEAEAERFSQESARANEKEKARKNKNEKARAKAEKDKTQEAPGLLYSKCTNHDLS